jgi:hypothetical protein
MEMEAWHQMMAESKAISMSKLVMVFLIMAMAMYRRRVAWLNGVNGISGRQAAQ